MGKQPLRLRLWFLFVSQGNGACFVWISLGAKPTSEGVGLFYGLGGGGGGGVERGEVRALP